MKPASDSGKPNRNAPNNIRGSAAADPFPPVPSSTAPSAQVTAARRAVSNAVGPAPNPLQGIKAWADFAFWPKVKKSDGCWLWTGAHDSRGYGITWIGGRKKYGGRSHHTGRVSLWLANGEWPLDRQACHRCDNPPCVRPDHLYWGLPFENARDAVERGRRAANGRAFRKLRSAAPDLYEALEEAVGVLSDLYDGKSVLGRVLDAIDTGTAALRSAK